MLQKQWIPLVYKLHKISLSISNTLLSRLIMPTSLNEMPCQDLSRSEHALTLSELPLPKADGMPGLLSTYKYGIG